MGLERIVSKRPGSRYRSGQYRDWIKSKNPAAPAVRREEEEDWGKCASRSKTTQSGQVYASHASHQTDGG
jgi:hypothetical protein